MKRYGLTAFLFCFGLFGISTSVWASAQSQQHLPNNDENAKTGVPNKIGNECVATQSIECRISVAAISQNILRRTIPDIQVDALDEVIEYTASGSFNTEEARLEFRNVMRAQGLEAALCSHGFKKAVLQSSFSKLDSARGEYDFDCPSTGKAPFVATEIMGHKMGESVSQYVAEAGYPNFLNQCHQLPAASQNELVRESEDYGYSFDEKVTKEEKLEWKAAERLHLDLRLCANAMLAERGQRGRLVKDFRQIGGAGGGTATFDGGKLVRFEVTMNDMAKVLPSLTEKYGQPTATSSVDLQNAYGATFTAGRAMWEMPDGTKILAIEDVEFSSTTGYFRSTDITFLTKEEASREESRSKTPNPFDH